MKISVESNRENPREGGAKKGLGLNLRGKLLLSFFLMVLIPILIVFYEAIVSKVIEMAYVWIWEHPAPVQARAAVPFGASREKTAAS